ncbi:AAA family ATPase [Kitasatospora purpeofusca]|uniref:AAA family ATPase n=1 Tax=Kitasatospora purpeofusca TaxID=67352 RepID=UPI0035E26DDB
MYVTKLRIDGVRGFYGPRACDLDFTRPDGTHAGWTVLAGRNGSGKTTLLRAIVLGLTGEVRAHGLEPELEEYLTHGSSSASLEVVVQPDPAVDATAPDRTSLTAGLAWRPDPASEQVFADLWEETPPTDVVFTAPRALAAAMWATTPPPGWFLAAYGPFRRLTGTGLYERGAQQLDRSAALRTLFEEHSALTEAFDWLLALHLRALEKRPGQRELKAGVLRLLNDGLLPSEYHIEDVDSDGMWFRHRDKVHSEDGGPRIELRRMSDGQRTVVALVLDIVRQMHTAYGSLKFVAKGDSVVIPHPGVVLIDEVDAHLHMTWQKRIGEWLTAHFPAVQFIVSTHSPYICQAADPGGLIRLPGPGEQVPPHVVDADLYSRIVYGTGDDAALSELFGLDSPYSKAARELRDQLADLEFDVLTGQADAERTEEYLSLRDRLASSPVARVDEVMGRYLKSQGHQA